MKTSPDPIKYLINKANKASIDTEKDLLALKRLVCKKFKIAAPPTDTLILKKYHQLVKQGRARTNLKLEKLLRKRSVRTMSGVAIIAVLTKSAECPGDCLYCPTEKTMPKSYLSNEPAVMRAIANKFDPFDQVKNRLLALHVNGHKTDKCELIVIGGTWSALDKKYQTHFIKRCLDGFNGRKSKGLEAAKKLNQKTKNRVVGLTLETRPDYITEEEIFRMRKLGATRVELGVQTIDDLVLKKNKRGHDTQEVIRATKLLRQAGFKVTYHFMPGLLGSNPQKDLAAYKELFKNPGFQPDQVKIYPCVVTKNSDLYRVYKNKKYKPYSDKVLRDLLKKMKQATPPYVRIARLIRDIPAESIVAGNKITNLRQLIQTEGVSCKCIRCREAKGKEVRSPVLIKREYRSSQGREIFLSYESKDKKILYAFLRLRLQKDVKWYPILENAALIRELHTYGELIPVGSKKGKIQHVGFGKKLMQEAEKIIKKAGYGKIAVIAGVGVRGYYQKLGYSLEDEYMIKRVDKLG